MLEIVNLVLWEGGISCSCAFLVICEFRGRDLTFCGEPHISIYFTDIKSFFNLDNLEPAPGRLAQELEVKALKIHEIPLSLSQIDEFKILKYETFSDLNFCLS